MRRRFAVAGFALACLAGCAGQVQQGPGLRAGKKLPAKVCTYVAAAFQSGGIRKIARPIGELVRADGSKAQFTVLDAGSAHVQYFASPDGDDLPDKFYIPEKLWSWDDLYIVPYGGRSYVVHADEGELKSVSEPNVGVTCEFSFEIAPKLVKNLDPVICAKLEKNDSWDFPELTGLAVSMASDKDPAAADLPDTVVSTTHFDLQGKPVMIAQYRASSYAGPGCNYAGMFFVANGKEEESPRNTALSKAQDAVADCKTSSTMLVSINGEILVKLAGRIGGTTGMPSRRLARFKGDQIEEICRVDETRSYTPREPQD